MNRYAAIALTISSMFLVVMAILVDSPALFYMATAIIATLGASRLQAWLAVRGLRFERSTAPAVRVGELVFVDITVWSDRRLKRPLVTVVDALPKRLVVRDFTDSLPVAPSFDQPIKTRYSFRPMRRGKYRWSNLTVFGTDALGLVTLENTYTTDPVELTVYPAPLPVMAEINPVMGWGASDLDSGRVQGAGLEPRGIREFAYGDPLRYIHWRSSARRGQLMVKEFETGSGVSMAFFLQRTEGTDIGTADSSTFEAMCGHTLFLAAKYIQRSATVYFPTFEPKEASRSHPEIREREIRELLTEIQPDQSISVSAEVAAAVDRLSPGETVVVLVAVRDPNLPGVLATLRDVRIICLVYDAFEYVDPKRPVPGLASAADTEYIGQLENSGAEVMVMPKVERLG